MSSAAEAAQIDPHAYSNAPMNTRRVLGLALPTIGEFSLQTMVGTVNTLMVAGLGKEAIAGVGAAQEMVFLVLAVLGAVGIGATVLIAQAIGAGQRDYANHLARQAIVWGAMLSIPITIVGLLSSRQLIRFFSHDKSVVEIGSQYIQIITGLSVFLLLNYICSAILRGAGDSKTPLKAAVVANIVNIVVSWVLIYGELGMPEVGAIGVAWGAVAGRLVAAAILIYFLVRPGRVLRVGGHGRWWPEVKTGRDLFRLGIPAALEEVMISAGFIVILGIVASLGTAALAAQQISFTALSLAFLPSIGFGVATTALVGQSIGAGRKDHALAAYHIAMKWSIIGLAVGGAIYAALARPILTIFTSDPEVLGHGENALRSLGVTLPLWAVWIVTGFALRGTGDTRTPLLTSFVGVWGAAILAWLLVAKLDRGLGTVWLVFAVSLPFALFWNKRVIRRRLADTPDPAEAPVEVPVAGGVADD